MRCSPFLLVARAALAFFLLLAGCDARPGAAIAQERERVVLRARHPAGVPLHPGERDRAMSGRLRDGSEVEVLRWSADRRWLEVRAIDGTRGWITARYVAEEGTRPRPLDPWSSRQACLAVVRGERPVRAPDRARFASWNLRWFPDGSSHGPSESPTDVEWVACLLAVMRVDAVALQEVMLHERGRAAVDRLRARLGELAGGRWEAIFDGCRRDGRQHVGWLYDAARLRIDARRQIDAVNPRGGCAHHLRPALAARFTFSAGLDLTALVVHLDSGQTARDHGHRRQSVRALVSTARALRARHRDDDVLILGDLNTMGCRECAGRIDAARELAAVDALLAPALARVAPRVPCTELYRGRGSLLDHALASASMRELPAGARAEVHGPCARHRCRLPRGARPPMLDHLSDHCPLVVELDGADRD